MATGKRTASSPTSDRGSAGGGIAPPPRAPGAFPGKCRPGFRARTMRKQKSSSPSGERMFDGKAPRAGARPLRGRRLRSFRRSLKGSQGTGPSARTVAKAEADRLGIDGVWLIVIRQKSLGQPPPRGFVPSSNAPHKTSGEEIGRGSLVRPRGSQARSMRRQGQAFSRQSEGWARRVDRPWMAKRPGKPTQRGLVRRSYVDRGEQGGGLTPLAVQSRNDRWHRRRRDRGRQAQSRPVAGKRGHATKREQKTPAHRPGPRAKQAFSALTRCPSAARPRPDDVEVQPAPLAKKKK